MGSDVQRFLSPRVHNALFQARGLPFLYLPLPVADFEGEGPTRSASSSSRPSADSRSRSPGSAPPPGTSRAPRKCARPGPPTLWFSAAADGAPTTPTWTASSIRWPTMTRERGGRAVVLGTGGAARAAVVAARGWDTKSRSRAARRGRGRAGGGARRRFPRAVRPSRDPKRTSISTRRPWVPAGGGPARVSETGPRNRPLVFDCVYRRDGSPTATIGAARAARCPVVEGRQMFAAQALRQARLFGVVDALSRRSADPPGGAAEGARSEKRRFAARAKAGVCVPVARELAAGAVTPVALLQSMRRSGAECFLLESVEGAETAGALHVRRAAGRLRDWRCREPCGSSAAEATSIWRRSPLGPWSVSWFGRTSSPIRNCRRSAEAPSGSSDTTRSASSRRFRTATRRREPRLTGSS